MIIAVFIESNPWGSENEGNNRRHQLQTSIIQNHLCFGNIVRPTLLNHY